MNVQVKSKRELKLDALLSNLKDEAKELGVSLSSSVFKKGKSYYSKELDSSYTVASLMDELKLFDPEASVELSYETGFYDDITPKLTVSGQREETDLEHKERLVSEYKKAIKTKLKVLEKQKTVKPKTKKL